MEGSELCGLPGLHLLIYRLVLAREIVNPWLKCFVCYAVHNILNEFIPLHVAVRVYIHISKQLNCCVDQLYLFLVIFWHYLIEHYFNKLVYAYTMAFRL